MRTLSHPKPDPLTHQELQRIWRWKRWMIRYYAMAITMLAVGVGAGHFYGDKPWARPLIIAGVLAFVLFTISALFREKCPRCGSRLGGQSRMILPDECRGCGVEIPRPPRLDSELDN
jgi:hypothetical protein